MSNAEVAKKVVYNLMFFCTPNLGQGPQNLFFFWGGAFVNRHHFTDLLA